MGHLEAIDADEWSSDGTDSEEDDGAHGDGSATERGGDDAEDPEDSELDALLQRVEEELARDDNALKPKEVEKGGIHNKDKQKVTDLRRGVSPLAYSHILLLDSYFDSSSTSHSG